MNLKRLLALAALVIAFLPASASADEDNRIDLRLFGENVVQGWDGCSFSLWQDDKDPASDRFAYVFFAPVPDGEALPGWIKIGDEVIELSMVDIGSADTGMLEPFRFYRSQDGGTRMIMEIAAQERTADGIAVGDARLTFLRNNKFPFTIRVKGLNGCPSRVSPDLGDSPHQGEAGLALGDATSFDRLDDVPAGVLRAIADQAPDCEPQNTAGYSDAYAISDAMTLWDVPCVLYASRGSSVFVVALTAQPDMASVLFFPAPPGAGMSDRAEILTPAVDARLGLVSTEDVSRSGDCGTYEKFALREAEGESVEFVLLEYREKTDCDGIAADSSGFPLVYRGQ